MTETEDYDKSATPTAHDTSHEKGGSDEINVEELSGVLADEQNAGKVKGVIVDDSGKADQKVLAWDEATNRIVYITAAITDFMSLDVIDPTNLLANAITVGLNHAIT